MHSKTGFSFGAALKAVAAISLPTAVVLGSLVIVGKLDFTYFVYGYLIAILLYIPMVLQPLASLQALAEYVNGLAQDKRVKAPNLKSLKNLAALQGALLRLQRSWERQKQEMETVITEREILVDTLPDILIMTNNDKVIVRTNRAARNVFGQNLAGRAIHDVVGSDKLLHAIDDVIEDYHGQKVEFYLESVARDFQATVERFPIPSASRVSIIITLNDITQQKHIQRMRADFVANASHEIRTPLASIIGFIETLRGPAKDDAHAREDFLKVMAEQAERMSKLVNDLLSLSKIEMNAHNVPTGRVDMARLLKSEKQHFDWPAQQKRIQIRMQIHDHLPLVKGDEGELAQVVRNLLGNAVKYAYADTEVSVTLRATSDLPKDPALRGLSRAICFSVQDKGEGIPKDHIPRLTERFYRVDSARTRKVGGTGLGLAIVKHVLNRHHGLLTIESDVGVGSIFTAYLPIYEETVMA